MSDPSGMNANHPQNGAGRPLPKKEADLFKNLVKQYEMKQYKKAIKHADTILKKFPKHGETLAMKGLTYNYMSGHTRDEAHALVKEGLKHDMRCVPPVRVTILRGFGWLMKMELWHIVTKNELPIRDTQHLPSTPSLSLSLFRILNCISLSFYSTYI